MVCDLQQLPRLTPVLIAALGSRSHLFIFVGGLHVVTFVLMDAIARESLCLQA